MDKFVDRFKKRLTDAGCDAASVDAWCEAHKAQLDKALEGVAAIHSPGDIKAVLKRLDDLFVEGAYADLGPKMEPAEAASGGHSNVEDNDAEAAEAAEDALYLEADAVEDDE